LWFLHHRGQETSLAQVPSAEAMMLAIAISAGETAPPRHTVGRSDTNPAAQMTNRDPAVHSLRLLSQCAPLVLFVFVLLIIIARRMITDRGAQRSGWT
jgi:ABC-type phosphate transport system permease subunit